MELKQKKELKDIGGLFAKNLVYQSKVIKELTGEDLTITIKCLDGYGKRLLNEKTDTSRHAMAKALKDSGYDIKDCYTFYGSLGDDKEYDKVFKSLNKKYGDKLSHMLDLYLLKYNDLILANYEVVKDKLVSVEGYNLEEGSLDNFPYEFKAELVEKIEDLSKLSPEDKENLQ